MGGSLFAWSGMPAGWLSGALVFTAIAALAGVNVGVAGWLRQPTFVVLGTSMGSAMSPDTLQGITTWPVTMLALLVSVPVMMTAVVLYLEKVAGWDRRSAFFAAVPGALSAVLAMAESTGADTRRVVFGQSLRLFALVALLPLALGGFGHQPAAAMPAVAAAPDAASFMTSMLIGITGACLFERLKFPGGAIVGAMLASGVAHGSGLIEGRLPDMFLDCRLHRARRQYRQPLRRHAAGDAQALLRRCADGAHHRHRGDGRPLPSSPPGCPANPT